MDKQMIGHTRYDDAGELVDIETLQQHSLAVADMCQKFGEKTKMGLVCRLLGIAHDMGKATDIFGKRVGVIPSKCGRANIHYPHMMTGALHLLDKYGDNNMGHMLASIVAGHHGGLRNWSALPSDDTDHYCVDRDATFKKMQAEYELALKSNVDYAVYQEVYSMLDELSLGCLDINADMFGKFVGKDGTIKDRYSCFWGLLTRLNFSRLIDADCLSTEFWYNPNNRVRRANDHDDLHTINQKLDAYVRTHCNSDGLINKWRSEIMKCAKKAACAEPGLFTMEADVGGGKTLAMLSFSLLHAINNGMDRVIYVAPFGSIIEQTADVFRGIFGENNICVHHMNMDTGKMSADSLLACDNWDAPIVVSSVEQLFDSLYSNKNSRCRKIHNMANAVIAIDEFHDIPLTTMWHVAHAVDALVSNCMFGSSVVLASATLPVLDCMCRTLRDEKEHKLFLAKPTQIVPDALFEAPNQRVKITYEPDIGGPENWESVALSASAHDQSMVIVNTRLSAYKLTKCMEKLGVKNVIHLSASLTPAGRELVLSRVLQMLKNGEPVHLVCTSIVQTGVDISFPYVYREMCGWTALRQASGRCNRNAEREIGYCIMFAKTGDDIPGLPALQTKAMEYLLNTREVDGDPEKIDKKAYWEKYVELYKAACKNVCPFDKNRVESFEIVDEDLSFETISEKARIIEDGQQVLMVMCDESRPYIEKMERFYSITTEEKEKLSKEQYTGMMPTKIDRRIVQRYSVNCYGSDYKKDNEQKFHLVHWLVTNGYAHKVGDDETADLVNHIGGTYVLDKGYDEVFGISSLMDQFISSKKGNR